MPGKFIHNYAATAIAIAADDYDDIDGVTNGTRRILVTTKATLFGTQLAADGMIFAAGSAAAPKLAIGTAGNGIYASAANVLDFTTAGAQRWQITSAGILQSPGAGVLGTATGALLIQTAGGNGNIRIQPNGTGKSGANITTPVTEWHVGTSLTTSPRGIMSAQYTTDALGARIHMRKARGTEAVPTIVVTGDDLGRIQWAGQDGTGAAGYLEMASIRAAVTGTVAAGRVPTQLIFSTATDAATSVLTDRMWLSPLGYLGIGASGATPLTFLDVSSAGAHGLVLNQDTATASVSSRLFFKSNGGTFGVFASGSTLNINSGAGAGSSSGTERVTIVNTGAVGIGTTVPGSFGLAVNQATGQVQDWIYNDGDGSPANHMSLVISSGGNATFAPSGGLVTITGALTATAVIRLKSYTVATLPAGTQGDTAFVTDALTPAFLVTVVGGGAVVTSVFFNGTNWVAQ